MSASLAISGAALKRMKNKNANPRIHELCRTIKCAEYGQTEFPFAKHFFAWRQSMPTHAPRPAPPVGKQFPCSFLHRTLLAQSVPLPRNWSWLKSGRLLRGDQTVPEVGTEQIVFPLSDGIGFRFSSAASFSSYPPWSPRGASGRRGPFLLRSQNRVSAAQGSRLGSVFGLRPG